MADAEAAHVENVAQLLTAARCFVGDDDEAVAIALIDAAAFAAELGPLTLEKAIERFRESAAATAEAEDFEKGGGRLQ